METITTMITTIATAISAFIAATTLLLTFLKYREKTKAEHANRMFEMLMRTRKNPDTINFFQMIDYSENEGWYKVTCVRPVFRRFLTITETAAVLGARKIERPPTFYLLF